MRLLAPVALAAVLFGCASDKPGMAYVKAHPELDPETRRRIAEGEAFEGMTAEQVIAALGGPINVERIAGGTEHWDYRSAILTFQDGVLVSWIHKNRLY